MDAQIERDVARQLIEEAAKSLAAQTRDYSGRGMMGKECVAISGSGETEIAFELGCQYGAWLARTQGRHRGQTLDRDAVVRALTATRSDQLGHGRIVYWPQVPFQMAETGEDDEALARKREELARLEAEFAAAGGRGVELADRIDALRAELGNDEFSENEKAVARETLIEALVEDACASASADGGYAAPVFRDGTKGYATMGDEELVEAARSAGLLDSDDDCDEAARVLGYGGEDGEACLPAGPRFR